MLLLLQGCGFKPSCSHFFDLATASGAKVGLKLRLCPTVDITWLLSVGSEMHAHTQSAAMLFRTSPQKVG